MFIDETKIPTDDEVQRLISATDAGTASGIRDRALLQLQVVAGLRAGELRALDLADLDLDAGTIEVSSSKTGQFWSVPLPKSVVQSLILYIKRARPVLARFGGRALFFSNQGTRIGRRGMAKIMARLRRAAGLPVHLTLNSLRLKLALLLLTSRSR